MAKSTKSAGSTKSTNPAKSARNKVSNPTAESRGSAKSPVNHVESSDSPGPAPERRGGDRRKVQRRRQIDPTTCERDYSNEEIEFMRAMDEYKRASGRMFPTCSEILEVFRGLGYMRPNPQSENGDEVRSLVAPAIDSSSMPASLVDAK